MYSLLYLDCNNNNNNKKKELSFFRKLLLFQPYLLSYLCQFFTLTFTDLKLAGTSSQAQMTSTSVLQRMCDGNIFITLIQGLALNFPQEVYSRLAR